jgi:hypothetical protein
MTSEANERLHPFDLRLLRDGARVFAITAMFAREHEHEAAHTAVEQEARHVGQNELAIPRGDPSGNEQDPCGLCNSPRVAHRFDARGVNRRGIGGGDVDAAWNDGNALERNLVTRHGRRGGEVRWRDHPIAARERAGPIAAQPGSRHVEQRGDEPDRDARRGHAGDPGATDALRVHDIDVLGGDQTFQSACATPELERIDRSIHEWSPFAAEGGELSNERPLLGCHERAGAGLYQRRGYVERGAGDRLLAQRRYDLQDGRVRQGVRGRMAIVVLHGGQFPRPASACLPLGHPCIQWRHAAKHARRKRAPKTRFPK